jgi:hypothetical protein
MIDRFNMSPDGAVHGIMGRGLSVWHKAVCVFGGGGGRGSDVIRSGPGK